MKVYMVDLRKQFKNPHMKRRPCIILSRTKKHCKVVCITHRPLRGASYNANVIPIRLNLFEDRTSYIDCNVVFTVRNEFVEESTYRPVSKAIASELKKTMKSITPIRYVVSMDSDDDNVYKAPYLPKFTEQVKRKDSE